MNKNFTCCNIRCKWNIIAHHISVINAYRLVHAVLGLKSHEKTEACQFHYMRCGKQFVGRLLEHRIKKRWIFSPVASVTILPVVPVANKLWRLSTPQYAMQNCTINSFSHHVQLKQCSRLPLLLRINLKRKIIIIIFLVGIEEQIHLQGVQPTVVKPLLLANVNDFTTAFAGLACK